MLDVLKNFDLNERLSKILNEDQYNYEDYDLSGDTGEINDLFTNNQNKMPSKYNTQGKMISNVNKNMFSNYFDSSIFNSNASEDDSMKQKTLADLVFAIFRNQYKSNSLKVNSEELNLGTDELSEKNLSPETIYNNINTEIVYPVYIYRNVEYIDDEEEAISENRYYLPKYSLYIPLTEDGITISDFASNESPVLESFSTNDLLVDALSSINSDKIRMFGKNAPKSYIYYVDTGRSFIVFRSNKTKVEDFKKLLSDTVIKGSNKEKVKKDYFDIIFKGPSIYGLNETVRRIERMINESNMDINSPDNKYFITDRGIFLNSDNKMGRVNLKADSFEKLIYDIINTAAKEYNIKYNEDSILRYLSDNTHITEKYSIGTEDVTKEPISIFYDNLNNYDFNEIWSKVANGYNHTNVNYSSNKFISTYGRSIVYPNFNLFYEMMKQYLSTANENGQFKRLFYTYYSVFDKVVPSANEWSEEDKVYSVLASMLINGLYNKEIISYTGIQEHVSVFKTFGNANYYRDYIDENNYTLKKTIIANSQMGAENASIFTPEGNLLTVDHVDGIHFSKNSDHPNNAIANLELITSKYNTERSQLTGEFNFVLTPTERCLTSKEFINKKIKWTLEFNTTAKLVFPNGAIIGDNRTLNYQNNYDDLFTLEVKGSVRSGSVNIDEITKNMNEQAILVRKMFDFIDKNTNKRFFFIDTQELTSGNFSLLDNAKDPFRRNVDNNDISQISNILQNNSSKNNEKLKYSNNIKLETVNNEIEKRYGGDLANRINNADPEFQNQQSFEPETEESNESIIRNKSIITEKKSAEEEEMILHRNMASNILQKMMIEDGVKHDYNIFELLQTVSELLDITTHENNNTIFLHRSDPKYFTIDFGIRKECKKINDIENDMKNWKGSFYEFKNTRGGQFSLTDGEPNLFKIHGKIKRSYFPVISVTGRLGFKNYPNDSKHAVLYKGEIKTFTSAYPDISISDTTKKSDKIIKSAKDIVFKGPGGVVYNDVKSIEAHVLSASSWWPEDFMHLVGCLYKSKYSNPNSIVVHHINSIPSDFRPDNLRFVCTADNTAFDTGNGVSIYRITPGTGTETPVMTWRNEKSFFDYSKDNDSTFYDKITGKTIRWAKSEVSRQIKNGQVYIVDDVKGIEKQLDNSRMYDKLISDNIIYILRRVILQDRPYIEELATVMEEEKHIKFLNDSIIGKEGYIRLDDGQIKSQYRSSDDPDLIIETSLDNLNENDILYHYKMGHIDVNSTSLDGNLSEKAINNIKKYKNIIQNRFYEENIIKRIANEANIKEKIRIIKNESGPIKVRRLLPEHAEFLWENVSDQIPLLNNYIENGILSPDMIPDSLLEKIRLYDPNRDNRVKNKEAYMSFHSERISKKAFLKKTRQNFLEHQKFYDSKNTLFKQALDRLNEKKEGDQ